MKRVLLTGMSGTGKSTVVAALAARGYRAVDLDTGEWSHWVALDGARGEDGPGVQDGQDGQADSPSPTGVEIWQTRDWVWREDRVRLLLTTAGEAGGGGPGGDGALFVSGCSPNQGRFYPLLDHIVLLSAPVSVITARLASRPTNTYGKHPAELARVLDQVASVEPRLRARATLEVDTSAPLERVIEAILDHVRD